MKGCVKEKQQTLSREEILSICKIFHRQIYSIFLRYSAHNEIVMEFANSFLMEHIAFALNKGITNKNRIIEYLKKYIEPRAHAFCQYWLYGESDYYRRIILKSEIKQIKEENPDFLINDIVEKLKNKGYRKSNIANNVNNNYRIVYLYDKTSNEDDGQELINTITTEEDLLEQTAKTEMRNLIGQVLQQLNEKERYVISERYLTGDIKTLEEIGNSLNISKERVRVIEKKALEKMKKIFMSMGLKIEDIL